MAGNDGRAKFMDDLAGMAGGAFSVLAGIRAEAGQMAKSKAAMGWHIWKNGRRHATLSPEPAKLRKDAFKALRRHLLYRMDRRQIILPASAGGGPQR